MSEIEKFKIIVADDEGATHLVTEMILKDFQFEGKSLEIFRAFTAKEVIRILENNSDIAIILLDIVMESYTAGLDIIPIIRNDLNNKEVRIILRSGHSGIDTISNIIKTYDVNDFRTKTFLSDKKLIDIIIIGLRNYRDIQLAKNLDKK